MALVRARHAVFGVCLIPATRLALHPDEWTAVDAPIPPRDVPFNPAVHNVPEVLAYLADASPSERARVLAAERSSDRPRQTVLAVGDDSTPIEGN